METPIRLHRFLVVAVSEERFIHLRTNSSRQREDEILIGSTFSTMTYMCSLTICSELSPVWVSRLVKREKFGQIPSVIFKSVQAYAVGRDTS